MSKFTNAVERNLEGLSHVAPGCKGPECEYADGDDNHQCESHFSWSPCDSCGSTLGGDRQTAYAFTIDDDGHIGDDPVKLSICVDCVMYHANGDEPECWEG